MRLIALLMLAVVTSSLMAVSPAFRSGVASQKTAEAPTNTLTGTARPGNVLTSTGGGQWRVNGASISGQTGSTLTVQRAWVAPGDTVDQVNSINNLTVVAYDTDAATDITAVATAGSDWGSTTAQRNNNRWAYDELIRQFKADSVYAALDDFYRIMAGPTSLNGALALGKGGTLTNTNFVSGDYAQLTGLKGSTNKHLSTGVLANAYGQNDVACWMYITEAMTTGDSTIRAVYGDSNGTAAGSLQLYKNSAALTRVSRARTGSTDTSFTPAPDGWLGLTGTSRDNMTTYVFRSGGTSSTITRSSNGVLSPEMTFYARAGSNPADMRAAAIGFHHAADLALIDAAIAAYLAKLQ